MRCDTKFRGILKVHIKCRDGSGADLEIGSFEGPICSLLGCGRGRIREVCRVISCASLSYDDWVTIINMARLGIKDKSEFVLEPTANFAHQLGSSFCDAASSKRPTCGSKVVVKVLPTYLCCRPYI
jgi:hypothetical protein